MMSSSRCTHENLTNERLSPKTIVDFIPKTHKTSEMILTRGPIGHILDTTIRCVRAIRVQLPNKGKFAKLKPSLEKYLHYLMDLDHNNAGTIQRFLQQLKLLPRGNTSHFYALKYMYHLTLMALKQTNKTNLAWKGHKLEKLCLNRTKI